VDGESDLTSLGYCHYKRLFNMNSKIEPDENIMLQGCDIYYNNFSTSNKKVFYNVKNNYYMIDNNNNFLSQIFLTEESENGLLKLNTEIKNWM